MKTETLESLLFDQAMGELRPEVVELLEAYATQNPDAARQAAELVATVRLAREATAWPREAPTSPLAVARLQRVQTAMRRRTTAWELTRLAACVALGLFLGWQAHPNRSRLVDAVAQLAVEPASLDAGPERRQTGDRRQDFWSLANLEAAQREQESGTSRPASRYRLHWDSPVKMPQVEETL